MREAGIHAIIQKIHEDTETHSGARFDELKNNADAETKHEDETFADELAKRREMLLAHNEHERSVLLDRLESRYNRDLLTYRQSLIDEVFDMAALKLASSSNEEFSRMFKNTVRGLSGDFTLFIGQLSEGKLDKRAIDEAMAENSGFKVIISPERIPDKGGFLLHDERIEYNCLFEDLIENMKNEQSAWILKEVFAEVM
jgi:vacuolar-type H+-ATPase subunit E/Vma4